NLKGQGLLVDEDEFLSHHTYQGKLLHGTPKIDNILSIIRNGFVVSNATQGTAAFGRGTYSTHNRETACSYGDIIELPVKTKSGIRIIDWKKVETSHQMEALKQKVKSKEVESTSFDFTFCL